MRSRVFAAGIKFWFDQGGYVRTRSQVTAGVVTVLTATCDNVVTLAGVNLPRPRWAGTLKLLRDIDAINSELPA